MKKIFLLIVYFSISPSWLFCINNNIYDIANYLDKKSLSISGEFYYYDFAGVSAHWDYVFKSINGNILQLRGNPSTSTDVFGWKRVNITLSTIPDYYFVYLGDFDFDGDSRFDWILIQQSNQLAYKLQGNTINDTFLWTQKIPVSFYINSNQVVFTKYSNINTSTPGTTTPTPTTPTRPTPTTPTRPSITEPPLPTPPSNSTLEVPPAPK